VIATRVGYTGGSTADPTYEDLGDHTEAVQLSFDPELVGYAELLTDFFAWHNACGRAYSRQYRSAIWVQDAEQRRIAEAAKNAVERREGRKVATAIEDAGRFHLAEDYHQKYWLRGHPEILADLVRYYPEREGFLGSTAVARVNGWLSGSTKQEEILRRLPSVGLSKRGEEALLSALRR